jgi:hypothetical protein
VLVRGTKEADLERIGGAPSVKAVEIHPASLEEIFLAYMQAPGGAGERDEAEEAPV